MLRTWNNSSAISFLSFNHFDHGCTLVQAVVMVTMAPIRKETGICVQQWKKVNVPIITKFCTGDNVGVVNPCTHFGNNRLPVSVTWHQVDAMVSTWHRVEWWSFLSNSGDVKLSNRRMVEWYCYRIFAWWNGGVVESSIRRMVEFWNGGMVEFLNRWMLGWWNGGTVDLSNHRQVVMVQLWSYRIVEWWNVGVVESSNRRTLEWWSCGVVESLNRRLVEGWNDGVMELSNRWIVEWWIS